MAVTGTDAAAVRTGLHKATPREWFDAIEAMQDYFGFGPIMATDDFGWSRERIADALDELGY